MKAILKSLFSVLIGIIPLCACADEARPFASEWENEEGETVVVYFSCTGTTESVANQIAQILNAPTWEIQPKVPYSSDDLKYYTDCRADREQNDPSARPELAEDFTDIDKYEVVYLGYPIWHGQAPKIIYTFLETHNLAGKTIIPFCTSHSSGIGSSDTNLHSSAPEATWKPGKRFGSASTRSEIENWVLSVHPVTAIGSVCNDTQENKVLSFRIVDLKGQLVSHDIDYLPLGVYILESIQEDGNVKVTKILK